MPRLEACLVDAYDTIVTCDFGPLRQGVPALAGIPVAAWEQEYGLVSLMLNDGRMSKAEAFRQIMANCGTPAPEDLVADMVRRDQELLLAHARCWSRPGGTSWPTSSCCPARCARPSRHRGSTGTP